MADITEELCSARMANIKTVLIGISKDAEDTRKGVGNLNRRLFEGNGQDALDTVIKANAEWRLAQQRREEARRRFTWRRNLSWMVGGAGWAMMIIVYLLQR